MINKFEMCVCWLRVLFNCSNIFELVDDKK